MRLRYGLGLTDVRRSGETISTLVDDLVAYWSLDETSGTRADSVGSADLTDNNTVGYDTGKNGNAAKFTAGNAETLSLASGLGLGEGAWTVSAWILPPADTPAGGTVYLVTGEAIPPFSSEANLYRSAFSNNFIVTSGDATATVTEAPSGSDWMHLLAWFDASDSKVYLSVNGGSPVASSARTTPSTAASYLTIGDNVQTHLQDETAVWSRVLTSDERAELYNSGTGKFYNGTNFVEP